METAEDYWLARALLDWQVELGVDEAIADAPVNRYDLPDAMAQPIKSPVAEPKPAKGKPATPPPIPVVPDIDAPAEARKAASGAATLADLAAAMAAFEHCDLRKGARNICFADGNPKSRVMLIGEAPGREEDLEGRPFVGRAGQFLDKMLAAIDLGRANPDVNHAVYITNVVPWRPPSNRTPDAAEIAMMLPFLERHVALVDPEIVVVMGNTPLQAVLGQTGITRQRGQWAQAFGKPVLPMLHPAYLLRMPQAKREAWADLLALKARLRAGA